MTRRFLSILLLCGAVVLLMLSRGREKRTLPDKLIESTTQTQDAAADSEEAEKAIGGKSHARPAPVEATVDETFAALRVPLPEPVAFPEQTLRERIASFNALLKKSGVARERLRIGVNERSESKAALLDMKVPVFTAESATPRDILVHCCDSLVVRYVVRENGMAEIAPSED